MMPIILNGKEEYVIDVAKYEKMRRPYESRGFHFDTFESIARLFRFHTVGSVAEEILQERAKRGPVDYFRQFDSVLNSIRKEGARRHYTQ